MESFASENWVRPHVMEAADHNIADKLEELKRKEHSLRQEVITSELIDIVTGFEAATGRQDHSPKRSRNLPSSFGFFLDFSGPVHRCARTVILLDQDVLDGQYTEAQRPISYCGAEGRASPDHKERAIRGDIHDIRGGGTRKCANFLASPAATRPV
ncbi:MAG: F0F1 ATP synthase subunit gamma [Alphaproteobacteria bacterium]